MIPRTPTNRVRSSCKRRLYVSSAFSASPDISAACAVMRFVSSGRFRYRSARAAFAMATRPSPEANAISPSASASNPLRSRARPRQRVIAVSSPLMNRRIATTRLSTFKSSHSATRRSPIAINAWSGPRLNSMFPMATRTPPPVSRSKPAPQVSAAMRPINRTIFMSDQSMGSPLIRIQAGRELGSGLRGFETRGRERNPVRQTGPALLGQGFDLAKRGRQIS